MRFYRAISILTLTAFLPLAVGCSSRLTVPLDSDPGDTSPVVASNEPMKISGYTTADSEFHEWNGQMSVVGADSLEFTREVEEGYWPYPDSSFRTTKVESMRIQSADVASVELVEIDHEKTAKSLVLAMAIVGILALMVASYSPW